MTHGGHAYILKCMYFIQLVFACLEGAIRKARFSRSHPARSSRRSVRRTLPVSSRNGSPIISAEVVLEEIAHAINNRLRVGSRIELDNGAHALP